MFCSLKSTITNGYIFVKFVNFLTVKILCYMGSHSGWGILILSLQYDVGFLDEHL